MDRRSAQQAYRTDAPFEPLQDCRNFRDIKISGSKQGRINKKSKEVFGSKSTTVVDYTWIAFKAFIVIYVIFSPEEIGEWMKKFIDALQGAI